MGKFNADTMSGGSVPQVHAGLNACISKITMTETASGSVTIALAVLPGGARLVDFMYMSQTGLGGTGGEAVFVDIQGQTFMGTVAEAGTLRASAGGSPAMGFTLTSDATLTLQLCNCVGTGTAAQQITTIVTYLCDTDKD